MKFDRSTPGCGVSVVCRLENGKAFLTWEFAITEEASGECGAACGPAEQKDAVIKVRLTDRQENTVLECRQRAGQEELLEAVLLQPRLWRSVKAPYVYRMDASLEAKDGRMLDSLCVPLSLRELRSTKICGMEELWLSGEIFTPKAVCYSLPSAASEAERQKLILEDMQLMLQAGANCICLREEGPRGLFLQFDRLCTRLGFLLLVRQKNLWVCGWDRKIRVESVGEAPDFRGAERSFFPPEGRMPASLFYEYKAKWSETPFVYLVPESVRRLKSGNYTVICYSNCSRTALYSDGVLFEFQRGEGEFIFREIPAKYPCVMLTAEGDGCSASLSVDKSLVKQEQ